MFSSSISQLGQRREIGSDDDGDDRQRNRLTLQTPTPDDPMSRMHEVLDRMSANLQFVVTPQQSLSSQQQSADTRLQSLNSRLVSLTSQQAASHNQLQLSESVDVLTKRVSTVKGFTS